MIHARNTNDFLCKTTQICNVYCQEILLTEYMNEIFRIAANNLLSINIFE